VQNEPLEVTLKVTQLLEKLEVPYLIGGSLASTLYGLVRFTQDSVIITEMGPQHIEQFVSGLEKDFYIDHEAIGEAIRSNSSFNIIHRESMFKVDVFIPKPRPFLRSQLERAQRQTFSLDIEISAQFASPEDTILSKLKWYRLGGEVSDRQWRDILGVLKTRAGELDLDYLRKWAVELKVHDLLEKSIKETAL
jgi:hypothetical protein